MSHLIICQVMHFKLETAHPKAFRQTAIDQAHSICSNQKAVKKDISNLINAIFEQANANFEYLAPNHLFRFEPQIDEIQIGRVRAIKTDKFADERSSIHPNQRLEIISGTRYKLEHVPGCFKITMPPICWLVKVDAIEENVEKEGKWLIDIAISYLRLSHHDWRGHWPEITSIEPHPIRKPIVDREGIKFTNARVSFGGSSTPNWYEINQDVLEVTKSEKFIEKSELIFNPKPKSLAERVSQALGWLTRGRQAEDHAERLLHFFTAIEAILSSDDKSAPITQTIARHGAVILTNDNTTRPTIAAEIKKMYGFRSVLVHTGNRSIPSSSVDISHKIAQNLIWNILEHANLNLDHTKFCEDLSSCSYGTPWPLPFTNPLPSPATQTSESCP